MIAAAPHRMTMAPESEMCVLGSLLIDRECAASVLNSVQDRFFTTTQHRTLLRAMRRLHASGLPIEPPTIADDLRASDELNDAGGLAYLGELLDVTPTAATVNYHVRILRDAYRERRPREIHAQAIAAYAAGELPPDEIEARFAAELAELRALADEGHPNRFLSAAEVQNLPKPEYLLDGVLVRKSLAVLFGAPGSGKSFLALDWALCIATGFRWFGREVLKGPIVYIAAEGAAGIGVRVRAWKLNRKHHGNPESYFLTSPATLLEPGEAERLIADIRRELPESPALIVVDTMSRCMPGADENSQADMSSYIAAVDRIREATGATILLVHHTNAVGERERGSTVLRGAADTMVMIKSDDGAITVSCEKQKDSAPFSKITLELQPLDESAVITAKTAWQLPSSRLTEKEAAALESLTTSAPPSGFSASTWLKVSGMNDRTFYRAIKALQDKEFVKADRAGRGALYTPTEAGIAALTDNCQITANSLPDSDRNSLTATRGVLETPRPVSNGATNGRHDADYDQWENSRTVDV